MTFIFWACGCFYSERTTDLHRTRRSEPHQTSYSLKARVQLDRTPSDRLRDSQKNVDDSYARSDQIVVFFFGGVDYNGRM